MVQSWHDLVRLVVESLLLGGRLEVPLRGRLQSPRASILPSIVKCGTRVRVLPQVVVAAVVESSHSGRGLRWQFLVTLRPACTGLLLFDATFDRNVRDSDQGRSIRAQDVFG